MKTFIDKAPNEWDNIFNSMSDMVTIHDKDFNIICANKAAETNLKLPSLASGKAKCFRYYHGTSNPPEGCPSCKCLKTGTQATFETYEPHLKKYIEIRVLPRLDKENRVIGIIHIVRDITKQKKSEKRLRDSGRQLRNLTKHLLAAREQERKHIAREIHDELGQSLTALKMELMLLMKHSHLYRQAHHKIKSMLDIVDVTINTVQRISSDLRPELLDDLDLISAIKWHSRKFQKLTGITCRVESNTENFIADNSRDIALFRIVQEALTNVHRHAEATMVKVNLTVISGKQLKLEIVDNGKGILEERRSNTDSFGITGMRERIGALKGTLEINGNPNKGTKVLATIPLNGSHILSKPKKGYRELKSYKMHDEWSSDDVSVYENERSHQ